MVLHARVIRTVAVLAMLGGLFLAFLAWVLQPHMPQLALGLAAWAVGGCAFGLLMAIVRGPTELLFHRAPGRLEVMEPGAAPLSVPFAHITGVEVWDGLPNKDPVPGYTVRLRLVDGGVWNIREWASNEARAEQLAARIRAALSVESSAPEPRRPSTRVRERSGRLETLNYMRPTMVLAALGLVVFFGLFASAFGDEIPVMVRWGVFGFLGLVTVAILSSAVPRWMPVQIPFGEAEVGTIAVDLEPGSGTSLRFARVDCPQSMREDNWMAVLYATRTISLGPLRLADAVDVAERLRARCPNLRSTPAAPT